MADTTTKTLEIVLKGRDDGTSSMLDNVTRKANTLAQQLRQGGDIGELSAVKKFGKNVGEFLGTSQAGEIRTNADQMRAQAAADYGKLAKQAADAEAAALIVDKARVGAMRERADAAAILQRNLRAIDADEKKQITSAMKSGLFRGEYGPTEIKDEANVARAAAEKAYQDVLSRTVDVQMRAAASDKQRTEAFNAKREAARRYADELNKIAKAEADALKANRSQNQLGRGIAVAGGTLAAVNLVGGIAEAWDKANKKVEEGTIKAGEWYGEVAKGLPIIGSTVQKAETLMMTLFPQDGSLSGWYNRIFGDGKSAVETLREVNAEAAKLDKIVSDQNAARKNVLEVASKFSGANDDERTAMRRKATAELEEIKKARDEARAKGVLGDEREPNELAKKLNAAEKAVRDKFNQDMDKLDGEARRKRLDHQQKMADAITESNKRVADATVQATANALEDQGKLLEAKIVQIRAKTQSTLDEIAQRRAALDRETGLTPSERIGRQDALEREANAAKGAGASEERQARKTAGEKSAERTVELTQKILEMQAAGGNEAAKREMQKLAIVQEGLEVQKQINELLKDTSLTADQRSALQGQLAMLPGIADKRMAAIDQEAAKAVIGSQQAERTRLFDARGQTGFFNQSKQVNTLEDSSKKTSDNTKTLVEKFDKLITIIDQKLSTQTPAFAYL